MACNLEERNIIFTIFAGRREYLEILIGYLDALLCKGLVHEVHCWDYARNYSDGQYLKDLCLSKEYYKLFKPEVNFKQKGNHKEGCHWEAYYEYYRDNVEDNDILIKCDDDIVYIDVESFEKYLNSIVDDCLYYPNIINNDVCAYIQSKYGIHDLVDIKSVDPRLKEIGREEPITTWKKGWYKSSVKAHQVHELFLGNMSLFNFSSEIIDWGSRFSINMFAGNANTIRKYFKQFIASDYTSDEAFLSSRVCKLNNKKNKVVLPFVVSHFSFNQQNEGLLKEKCLKKYKRILIGRMEHRIDIIMPVYNVENYISTSILSVLNQTYSNFKLIVVDDKSTDNSLSIIEELARCDDRIRVIVMEQNSVGGAGIPSNIGIEASDADFVAFLDSDDIYEPNFLKAHYENLISSNAEVSLGRFSLVEDETNIVKVSYDKKRFDDLYSQYGSNAMTGIQKFRCLNLAPVPWSKVYRKSFFKDKNIRFPEGEFFYEDNPLHWDLCLKSDSIALLNEVLIKHRTLRVGQTTTRSDKNLLYFIPISNIVKSKISNKIDKIYYVQWFLREFRWRYESASEEGRDELLGAAVTNLSIISEQDITDAKNYFHLNEREISFISTIKQGIHIKYNKKWKRRKKKRLNFFK